MLTVSLFGAPTFVLNQQPISHLVTGRAAALLSYLALTRQPQPRALLADLLWAEIPEQQAKNNLRYRLSDLRKVIGDYVIATGEMIAFNQDLPHWVDATIFTNYLLPAAPTATPTIEPGILQALLNLYTGEFLAGFLVEGAPVFERWVLAQRRYLHDLLIQGLQLRTQQHLGQGEYAEGLALNHYLLTLEPWREEAHRQRMLLLAHSGQRSAALQQYTRCCQVLLEELDVPPMPQTTALYEAIKSGQWFAAHQSTNHSQITPPVIGAFPLDVVSDWQNRATPSMTPAAPTPIATGPRFDLGAMPTAAHFYGRQAELATLHSWVGQEQSRVITLFGVGGQGKTALAAAFVQDVIEDEQTPAHGFTQVIWRSLHDTPTPVELLQGWLQSLEATPRNRLPDSFDELVTRLFVALQNRRCLLVLDSLETIWQTPVASDLAQSEAYYPSHEAYASLLRLFFQRRHRSCLLLTSRRRPAVFTQLDEQNGAFRCLAMDGLPPTDSAALLQTLGVRGAPVIQELHHHYAGNPLLLRQAANLIHELFDGDGAAFVQEKLFFLGDIGAALAQQIAQLSSLEQQILYQLAQATQPLCRQMIWAQLTPQPTKQAYFHALQALQRAFFLQLVGEQVILAPLCATYLAGEPKQA